MNKHIKAFFKDIFKPSSVKDGEAFEEYAGKYFFPSDLYNLLHRSHDVNTNSERFVESSLFPDYKFRVKGSNTEFWIECKHRANYDDYTRIDVFKPGQLLRYKSFDNCFLFLCTYIRDEQKFYLVPMKFLKYDTIFLSFLRPYEVTLEPPILPGLIRRYIH